jgi:ADP-ribose pyrophosphatase YjhB (NUDIX family)
MPRFTREKNEAELNSDSAVCNHTSVGILLRHNGRILLIERAKFPVGYALPAGHVDAGEDYEEAAVRELREEVGLSASDLKLVAEGRKKNQCSRKGGSWHYWKIYSTTAKGKLKRNKGAAKTAGWYSVSEIKKLAARTNNYLSQHVPEQEWAANPGLEPVMHEWLTELRIIDV